MARNDYIAQRDAIRKEFFLAGMELEGQRTVDMLCVEEMKIGWRGKWLPDVNDADGGTKKEERQELMGTVVYVHPLGRFYVVKFDCGFCESFI